MTEQLEAQFIDQLSEREFMGYVNYVNPQYIQIHLPSFRLLEREDFEGAMSRAKIGDYLMVEGIKTNYLAKVLEIDTPRRSDAKFNSNEVDKNSLQLSVKAEVLLGFSEDGSSVPTKGLLCFPSIGDKAYYSSRNVIEGFLENFGLKYSKGFDHLELGTTTDYHAMPINVSQQSLFGRHCAVVGTTGGGKSWTLARLIGEMKQNDNAKIILIDPTGEYKNIEDQHFKSVSIAKDSFFSLP